jgi:hypothetical protein
LWNYGPSWNEIWGRTCLSADTDCHQTSAFSLGAVTGVVFAKPALAERFFMSFASSARTHYAEQAVRLLVGASLVVLSPAMWQTSMAELFELYLKHLSSLDAASSGGR